MARPPKVNVNLIEEEIATTLPDSPITRYLLKIQAVVEENPFMYIGGAVFIVLCIVAGVLFNASQAASDREVMTKYTAAMIEEEPATRLAKLEEISGDAGRWTPEVTYMLGETAIQAQQYDKAKQAFEQVLAKYGTGEFAARAADGLAFLEENSGNIEGALKGYQQVREKWGADFIATIRLYDIGRLQEKLGKLEDAKKSYDEQMTLFPDSDAARKAEQALEKLKGTHPELFPEEKKEEAPVAEATPATEAAPAAEAAPVGSGS